jgi:hypothetical protein
VHRGHAYSGLGSAWGRDGQRSEDRDSPLARIVDRAEEKLREQQLGPHMSRFMPHSFRHTVKTQMAALNVPGADSEAVLNHVPPGMEGHYDHFKPLPAMLKALSAWEQKLRGLGLLKDEKKKQEQAPKAPARGGEIEATVPDCGC